MNNSVFFLCVIIVETDGGGGLYVHSMQAFGGEEGHERHCVDGVLVRMSGSSEFEGDLR